MSKIILLNDILDHKKRKEKELIFYQQELEKLLSKMKLIKTEIQLTEKIIKLIRDEMLVEIKPRDKPNEF